MVPIKTQITGALHVLETWKKPDAYATLLPQAVSNGLIYNTNGDVIGACTGCEDKEVFPAEWVKDMTRVTSHSSSRVFIAVQTWMDATFGKEDDGGLFKLDDEETPSAPSTNETDNVTTSIADEIANLIGAKNIKKAKKMLKKHKEELDKDLYKKFKKEVKNG